MRLMNARGIKASLLDTALGEKTVGPPASLTLGHLEAGQYVLDDLYFAGSLQTARRMATIIAGATRLAANAEGRLVIDTSGTFNVPGRALKSLKIDALNPDHIVAIGQDDELEPFLAPKPQNLIHRLMPAEAVQARNAMARALIRLRAFQAVFAQAKMHMLRDLAVEPWDEDAFDWTQGEYICGLADSSGHEHGLGILNQADAAKGIFEITTTVEPSTIHRVRVGMFLPDELKT